MLHTYRQCLFLAYISIFWSYLDNDSYCTSKYPTINGCKYSWHTWILNGFYYDMKLEAYNA